MKRLIAIAVFCCSIFVNANIYIQPLSLEHIGKISQFDIADNGDLVLINQRGELWQIKGDKPEKLLEKVSTKIAPQAQYERIALADEKGDFLLWTEDYLYRSTIPMAENATMQALPFATIGVVKQKQHYKLARIEINKNGVVITALSEQNVLPDARPLQINLDENAQQGHIAVLAMPDNTTYQHGVLGDNIEAKSLIYFERHSLKPLAIYTAPDGLVLEANQLSAYIHNRKIYIVSALSGMGEGARTVLFERVGDKLQIKAQSEPLANHRWQSPFVFNQHLYAVQMPHLVGRLVKYQLLENQLKAETIDSGLSNHIYGEYETNLAIHTNDMVLVPQYGYREIAVIDKLNNFAKPSIILPAEISKTVANENTMYLLLENGQVWIVKNK